MRVDRGARARGHDFFTIARRTAVLVALGSLSAAWTITLVESRSVNLVSSEKAEAALSSDVSVPAHPIEVPASVSGSVSEFGSYTQVAARSSVDSIPSAALLAYQRAETVINSADETCHLSWQLVAAIGRVESNHGRVNGHVVDARGVVSPGIIGVALDGTSGVPLITDTDAGQYDDDVNFDRAVGPMQVIPSTWAVVGVDADGDGVRNPQDMDDAALATSVFLCAGDGDLATQTGQEAAVYRYNHSYSYVATVLSIMDGYVQGAYAGIPDGIAVAGHLAPDVQPAAVVNEPRPSESAGSWDVPETATQPLPSAEPPATAPVEAPSESPDDEASLPTVTLPLLPETGIEPVDETLTIAQAIAQCTVDGHVNNLLSKDDPFDACLGALTGSER